MLKILYGASLGLVAFVLGFMAPSGALLTTSASPERVQRQTSGPAGARSTRRSRSTYVFVGGFGK